MKKFYFIQQPEQIFSLKEHLETAIPVIPIYENLDDFNRIVLSMRRWGHTVAVFYERTVYPLKCFLEAASFFDVIFTFDAAVAKAVRETGFNGEIYLFSNFRMLAYGDFFKEFKVTPVVFGSLNFEFAKEKGMDPVYFVSDKSCIADFGLCISRKSSPQNFYNCDNRCREKSSFKKGLDFPLSIKPETIYPENSSFLVFSEKSVFPSPKAGNLKEQVLEKSWNYRYPLGIEILKSGKTENGKHFSFNLDANSLKLLEKNLVGFYGYSQSVYKGKWLEAVKTKVTKNEKLSVTLHETFQNLLMIHRYKEEEKDFLKRARHFIFTLPLPKERVLENIDEAAADKKEVSAPRQRKYSGKMKLTLISDDIKKFNVFKGRDVERKIIVYRRGIPLGFGDYLFISGVINDRDIEEIAQMKKLKGIVAPDGIVKERLEHLFPEKEILLHPLGYYEYESSPSFLSSSTTIFISKFKSEKRSNYSWKDINVHLRNQSGFSEFITKKRVIRLGGKKELWVNLTDVADSGIKYLKSQAEMFVRNSR